MQRAMHVVEGRNALTRFKFLFIQIKSILDIKIYWNILFL